MLNEMWVEASDAFCKAMSEKRFEDAAAENKKLDVICELLKYVVE